MQIYFMKKDKLPIPVTTLVLMIVTITYKAVLVVIGIVIICLILKKLTCSTSKLMSVATKSSGLSRHTIEEKIEAVRQRIFQESSFRELQERHGICSATLSVWIKKYKAEVLRRFPVKDLPLYVLKYQETMTTEEENELTRLRRENEDLKLLHEANLLMIDMAKERFGIDIKKNYEEMLSGGCLKEVPGVKGNDE